MSERLVKVTSFSELRTGMVTVVKPCTCGKPVRGMLIRLLQGGPQPDGSNVVSSQAWARLPEHFCSGYRRSHVLSPRTVADGIVFAVADGLEAPAATTRTKRPVGARP